MQLVRVSPLPAGKVVWQRSPNEWVVTVVSKITCTLEPGVSRLASDHKPLCDEDEHVDRDPARSVYAPGDFAPAKARADVVLVGSAYAPGGNPVSGLVTRIIVAELNKTIAVDGWRAVGADGAVQDAGPFSTMPITYEHAAGGPGTWNPVGVPRDARDGYGRTPLPNLHRKDEQPGPEVLVEPIGYGPLGRNWPSRRERLGRHESEFDAQDWSSRALPDGFDMSYFNVAPIDQQIAALKHDEALVLENLHREHGRLITKLPGVKPAVFLATRGGERLAMTADTLWIDTDRGIATVTFRGQTSVSGPGDPLRIVVAMDQPGKTIDWRDIEGAVPPPRKAQAATMSLSRVREEATSVGIQIPTRDGALPFMQGGPNAGRVPDERASRPDGALPFVGGGQGDPLAMSSSAWATTPSSAPAPSSPTPSAQPPSSTPVSAPPSPPTPGPKAGPLPQPQAPAGTPPRPAAASPWAGGASAAPAPVPVVPMVANPLAQAAAPAPAVTPLPTPTAAQSVAGELYALLWLHPECAPRVRRVKAFKPIFDELERKPVDWELDDAAPTTDPMELEDRREVFEVVARGQLVDSTGIRRALVEGVRPDGKFVPPVVLVGGDMTTPFDPLERLKATIATVSPLIVPTEEGQEEPELNKAVSSAKELAGGADELTPPSVIDAHSKRVREAFAAEKRDLLSDDYLDDETGRALLENRKYQKRQVFGEPHLRTLTYIDGPGEPIPTYLPVSLAAVLPMYARFKVRVVAEALTREDQYESHPHALRALAVARVLPPMRS